MSVEQTLKVTKSPDTQKIIQLDRCLAFLSTTLQTQMHPRSGPILTRHLPAGADSSGSVNIKGRARYSLSGIAAYIHTHTWPGLIWRTKAIALSGDGDVCVYRGRRTRALLSADRMRAAKRAARSRGIFSRARSLFFIPRSACFSRRNIVRVKRAGGRDFFFSI